MLHERLSVQREKQRARMDADLRKLPSYEVYGRVNDVYYAGFTQYGRDHLNEMGRRAEATLGLRENWQQLLEDDFGKAIEINQEEGKEIVGVILPVEADNSRHLVILNSGTVFVSEDKDHFEKHTYLASMSPSEEPLSLQGIVVEEEFLTEGKLNAEGTSWLRQTLSKECNVNVVRSSEHYDDLIAIEGVMEKVFTRVERLRLEKK